MFFHKEIVILEGKTTQSIFLLALICVLGNNNRNKGKVEVETLNLDLIFSTAALMIDGDSTLNHFKYHERRILLEYVIIIY